jgi:hypothetical protein cdiviTM7_02470
MSGPSNKDILAWMEIYYTSISGFIFLATVAIMYDSTLEGAREISVPILFVAGLISLGGSVGLAYKQRGVEKSRSSQKS